MGSWLFARYSHCSLRHPIRFCFLTAFSRRYSLCMGQSFGLFQNLRMKQDRVGLASVCCQSTYSFASGLCTEKVLAVEPKRSRSLPRDPLLAKLELATHGTASAMCCDFSCVHVLCRACMHSAISRILRPMISLVGRNADQCPRPVHHQNQTVPFSPAIRINVRCQPLPTTYQPVSLGLNCPPLRHMTHRPPPKSFPTTYNSPLTPKTLPTTYPNP